MQLHFLRGPNLQKLGIVSIKPILLGRVPVRGVTFAVTPGPAEEVRFSTACIRLTKWQMTQKLCFLQDVSQIRQIVCSRYSFLQILRRVWPIDGGTHFLPVQQATFFNCTWKAFNSYATACFACVNAFYPYYLSSNINVNTVFWGGAGYQFCRPPIMQ